MTEDALPVTFPLINPNEPEAVLTKLHVEERQHVSQGELLATLETTKSSADLEAEAAGFVIGLRASEGQTVQSGELLCFIAKSPDWESPEPPAQGPETVAGAIPDGLKITQPALALARQLGVNLEQLPKGAWITEATLREFKARQAGEAGLARPQAEFDPTSILIYGAGGHGKMAIDLLRALRVYHIAGIVDDGVVAGSSIMGVPVLGGSQALEDLHARGVRLALNAVGGIGNIQVRIKIFQKLAEAGFSCPAVVHPSAYVEPSAELSPGAQVFALAYVGSQAHIGYGAIINTGAVVSHDCRIGDYTNISPGALLAGEVETGSGVLVGMGATINLRVRLGFAARVGNGATVKSDVPERGVVRAGTIWPD
jgi:sugar O-acyltransferase (sialic acid O-acetyltransferase NeuD family)